MAARGKHNSTRQSRLHNAKAIISVALRRRQHNATNTEFSSLLLPLRIFIATALIPSAQHHGHRPSLRPKLASSTYQEAELAKHHPFEASAVGSRSDL
eukprot:9485140-Pyramimonas_sp.AAC.1